MSVRRLIVEVDTAELNVARFCREHGISTWFFYDLRRRYAEDGLAAIEPRSRAPHRVANRTTVEVEDAIVTRRKQLVDAGLDAVAATIHWHLQPGGIVVSEATIWRVLRRRGFITPDPSKRPKHAGRRFAAERANECWQFDDTNHTLADGAGVKIVHVIDDCSRLLVASRAVPAATMGAIFDTLCDGADEYGWPERMLCDNAKAHHALTDTFAALGIGARHPKPYHPQTCGKVERYHQTEKKWLAAQDPTETTDELQAQLDTFRYVYNHQRPHRAIARRTPQSVWDATPKSGPANQPLDATTDIRRLTVGQNGVISYSRRYKINVGTQHAGRPATLIATGLNCHVFIAGKLARELTLDPTRRNQPLTPTVTDVPRHP